MPTRLIWSVAIVLLALVAGLGLARPIPGLVTYYYDEHGRVVGVRGWTCQREAIEWGHATTRNHSVRVCRR
ncbi:MAG TPA: DUF6289 family protein [Lysobacter sp.]|nr:DUF6289 family protein [Lysobacter sp.]